MRRTDRGQLLGSCAVIPVQPLDDSIHRVEQGITARRYPVEEAAPIPAGSVSEPAPGADITGLHVKIEDGRKAPPDDLVRASFLRLVAAVVDPVDHRIRFLSAEGLRNEQRADGGDRG